MSIDDPSIFADKFSIDSPRLKNWDYSTPGIYFITICTLNHNNFFGKIIENTMVYSSCGQLARQCLADIPKHFSNIKLLDYVIMPNHTHILLELTDLRPNSVETHRLNSCRDVACNVSTSTPLVSINKHKNALPKICNKYNQQFFFQISPRPNSIPTIIRSYKSAVTRLINPKTMFFTWQPRFHDEIVKDEKQLIVIKQYIQNNAINWKKINSIDSIAFYSKINYTVW